MPFPIILAETPNTTVGGAITAAGTVVVAIIGGFFVWITKRRDSSFKEIMKLYEVVKLDNEDMRKRMSENERKMDENNRRMDEMEGELHTLKDKLRSSEEMNALAAMAAEAHMARADKAEAEKADIQRQLDECLKSKNGHKGGVTRGVPTYRSI